LYHELVWSACFGTEKSHTDHCCSCIITYFQFQFKRSNRNSTNDICDDKECKKNEGGNNCNDSKKNASPELECKHQIKDNEGSSIDSECTNNSQILTDSIIISRPGDEGGNGDFESPTVVSVDPNDGQNNVPLNTEIKVVFSESMDQDTLDDGSLYIFNLDGSVDPNVNANPSDKSVTYTLDRQLESGTRYKAQLDFNIQDIDGNSLDCSESNDVDSSCTWQFETTGNGNANIELSPTSGPFGTVLSVTGTGFSPNSAVSITFDGSQVATTQSDNNGDFDATFTVLSFTTGPKTVEAIQGGNSDSATFTVTSSVNPVLGINPKSGPVGTSVTVSGTGFDPSSTVTITFDGNPVTKIPTTVTTNPEGGFSGVTFLVPSSSTASKTVEATTQGSKTASKSFNVTSSPVPIGPSITLNPTSGPVDTAVTVTGIGFDPSSTVSITFDGSPITTTPATVAPNSNGAFTATFTVPTSSDGSKTVVATQGTNSASKPFTVISGTISAMTQGIASLPF